MAIYYSDNIKKVYDPTVTGSSSRYITKRRIVNDKQETSIRFIRKRDLKFNSNYSKVHVVLPIEEFRPDVIAYKYYGSEKFAWVILSANDLRVPYQLYKGMKIVIPDISTLQGSYGKLVTR